MNELFQHTVQPIGSSTSPVEDLALEISDAFNKISERLDIHPNIITSYKEAIGNPIFKDLKQHKITKQVTETHNILETESNIVLENIPDTSSLSLSYLYNSNNINLTEVNNLLDFTAYDQYKIEGKVITLNVKVQPGSSIAITAIYNCTTFDLNNEKILPNVFKKETGEWYLTATQVSESSYELDYDTNISDSLNNHITDLNSVLHIFSSEDGVNWQEVDVITYSIKSNKIEFKSDTLNFNRPEQHSERRLLALKGAIDTIDKKLIRNRQNIAFATLIRAIRHFISMSIDNTNYDLNYTSDIQNHFYKILSDIEKLNTIKNYMFKANIHIAMSNILKDIINVATQPITVAESIFSNCVGNDREHVTIKGLDYLISNGQEQVMVDSSSTLKTEEEVKISKIILPNTRVKLFKDKRKGEPIYNTIKQLIDYVEEHIQDTAEHTSLSFIVSKYLLNTLNKYFILDGIALDNYEDNLTVPEILQHVDEQQNYLNLIGNDVELEHKRKEFVHNIETIITEMDTVAYAAKTIYLTSFDRSVLHCIIETLKKR